MRIDLRQAKAEGIDVVFSPSAEELDLNLAGVEFPEPIEVNLTNTKSGDEVIIEGRITTTVELECSRCLEIYETPIKLLFRFIIQLLDISQAQETNDDDFVILPKNVSEYDLSDRVREAVIPLAVRGGRRVVQFERRHKARQPSGIRVAVKPVSHSPVDHQ